MANSKNRHSEATESFRPRRGDDEVVVMTDMLAARTFTATVMAGPAEAQLDDWADGFKQDIGKTEWPGPNARPTLDNPSRMSWVRFFEPFVVRNGEAYATKEYSVAASDGEMIDELADMVRDARGLGSVMGAGTTSVVRHWDVKFLVRDHVKGRAPGDLEMTDAPLVEVGALMTHNGICFVRDASVSDDSVRTFAHRILLDLDKNGFLERSLRPGGRAERAVKRFMGSYLAPYPPGIDDRVRVYTVSAARRLTAEAPDGDLEKLMAYQFVTGACSALCEPGLCPTAKTSPQSQSSYPKHWEEVVRVGPLLVTWTPRASRRSRVAP